MALFTALFSCFVPSLSSSFRRVSDDAGDSTLKELSSEKSKSKTKSSSGAPIVVSYFPAKSICAQNKPLMALFSAICCCFMPNSSSSKVTKSKDTEKKNSFVEAGSLSSSAENPKSSAAPIVVSYFPLNSQPSRL
ncbi:hypothetical protein O6P43_001322 [Quillaja saponaria]|uniref:Secreted protein n=1 Tax=Quillaja saponaria TaxID=32244 RepID=A0AAD7QIU2_QUISA|nr:hypothetical protein O6P43_001322 [Quillaja saponaria]